MKRALLFYPPQLCLEQSLLNFSLSFATNFPMALVRLSTHLKGKGYQVDFLDAFNVSPNTIESLAEMLADDRMVRQAPCGNFENERRYKPVYHVGLRYAEIQDRLEQLPTPDEVYVSSIFTWSWETTHRSIELIKQRFPKARVELGGVYPSLCPEKARESGADEIAKNPVPELELAWLDTGLLNQMPFVDGVVLKTSSGCPNQCSYCAVHILEGNKFAYRDTEDILAELDHIEDTMYTNQLFFWESNLLLKPDRHILRILENIESRSRQYVLHAPEGFQPDLVSEELAYRMKATGFRDIRLTLETTNPKRLREIRRPAGISDVERAAEYLFQAGFHRDDLYTVLLIGQPGQTLEMVLRDIIQVYRAGLQTTFLLYTPVPRTRDYQTHREAIGNRPLEDLDSALYPMASPELTVQQIESILEFFDDRYIPLSAIESSDTEDRLVRRMQEMIREEARVVSG
jgi:radical SAM superfamily enzyme YgiQ (UPF0313 family)